MSGEYHHVRSDWFTSFRVCGAVNGNFGIFKGKNEWYLFTKKIWFSAEVSHSEFDQNLESRKFLAQRILIFYSILILHHLVCLPASKLKVEEPLEKPKKRSQIREWHIFFVVQMGLKCSEKGWNVNTLPIRALNWIPPDWWENAIFRIDSTPVKTRKEHFCVKRALLATRGKNFNLRSARTTVMTAIKMELG